MRLMIGLTVREIESVMPIRDQEKKIVGLFMHAFDGAKIRLENITEKEAWEIADTMLYQGGYKLRNGFKYVEPTNKLMASYLTYRSVVDTRQE